MLRTLCSSSSGKPSMAVAKIKASAARGIIGFTASQSDRMGSNGSLRFYAAAKRPPPNVKRALQPDQIAGKSAGAGAPPPPKPPLATAAPPAAAGTAATDSGGGSSLLPLGMFGLVFVGTAIYYFSMEKGAPQENTSKSLDKTAGSNTSAAVKEADVVGGSSKVETSTPASVGSTGAGSDGANRVISIAVPDKMKNKSDAASPSVADHPKGGNRVSNFQPSATAAVAPVDDTSATTRALNALRAETVTGSEALVSPTASMSSPSFDDLDDLSASQLKARIVQLASELQDRTKWETVRLKEFMAMKEKETAAKYLDVLQTQKLEFEALMANRLREQEHALETSKNQAVGAVQANVTNVLNTALEAQATEHAEDKKAFEEIITSEIQSALQEKFDAQEAEVKQRSADEMQQSVAQLHALQSKVQQLEKALSSGAVQKQGSARAHRLSAAALALADALDTASQPAKTQFQALRQAAGNKGVIATACATMPARVQTTGVPTVHELQARFTKAYNKARQAALVPEGRLGLEGQLVGMFLATIKYPPTTTSESETTSTDVAETTLVRALEAVQEGHLELAVVALERLSGQAAYTLADWKRDAIDRIAVNRALKVIRMECALLNESCLEESAD